MYCGRPFMIECCWTDLSRTRLCPVGCSESAPGPLAQRGHRWLPWAAVPRAREAAPRPAEAVPRVAAAAFARRTSAMERLTSPSALDNGDRDPSRQRRWRGDAAKGRARGRGGEGAPVPASERRGFLGGVVAFMVTLWQGSVTVVAVSAVCLAVWLPSEGYSGGHHQGSNVDTAYTVAASLPPSQAAGATVDATEELGRCAEWGRPDAPLRGLCHAFSPPRHSVRCRRHSRRFQSRAEDSASFGCAARAGEHGRCPSNPSGSGWGSRERHG